MTTCKSCTDSINAKMRRCPSCGRSLVTRDDTANLSQATKEEVPYYIQTPEQERRTQFIANTAVVIVSILGVLGLIFVFALRFMPKAFFGVKKTDIVIQALTFNVVETDEQYYEVHGATKKVVIDYTVTNNGKRDVSVVDAKIYARSKEMQLWSKNGLNNEFHFVTTDAPLKSGESRQVKAEFPVIYEPHGLVTIAWDYEITKIEKVD